VHGAALRTASRGFARDHPRIELLRHTALFAGRREAAGAGGLGATRRSSTSPGVARGGAPERLARRPRRASTAAPQAR
jgi:hypothetical protein